MTTIETAVQTAVAKWQAAFNAADAAGCAACYEVDATMEAKPFGTFHGRASIEAFWADLIGKGFAEVRYVNPRVEAIDATSAVLTSTWTMNNAHGIITKELWVLQSDGTALLREDHFEAQG